MWKNHPRLTTLAAIVVGGIVLPCSATGQTAAVKSAPPPTPLVQLETRARVLIDTPAKWPEAARMLEEAAGLRTADDVRAVDDLIIAAAAHRWARERTAGRATYVRAGERALALGDVVRAANAFLCAAVIAHEQKDAAGAWELKTRAERLAQSPLLTDGQRKYILGQFSDLKKYADKP